MEPANQSIDAERASVSSFTATHATVIVAIIGAIGAGAGALFTSWEGLQLERAKHDAAADLARQEFETKLIFRAIEGSDSAEERTRNLKFFLDAGFIADPHDRIRNLNADQYPSKGNASFDCSKDKDPAARTICADPTLSARDKIMADQYYKLKQSLDPVAGRALIEEQQKWLIERNGCANVALTAVSCMAEKYDLRIVELVTRVAGASPASGGGARPTSTAAE
jgi:uncharacterized protein YecT (DUF1311 family)